jgi:hypothetical protein
MNYKTLLITVILLPAGLTLAGSSSLTARPSSNPSGPGSEARILEVSNKYGDIHVTQYRQ